MRATAEDPDTAELVGVNSRAVYAIAAAIAVATAALAGAFLAMRATFDPYTGPTQLIFAFEAVVIGGHRLALGDAGRGHRPRRRPDDRRRSSNPQWFDLLAGHSSSSPCSPRALSSPALARAEASRVVRARMSAAPASRRPSSAGRRSRVASIAASAVVVAAARARRRPPLSARTRRQADDALRLRDPGRDVECARRLRGPRLGRPAGVLRPRRLLRDPALARTVSAVYPALCSPALIAGRGLGPDRASFMLRLRGGEFAIGMWVVAEVCHLSRQQRPSIGGETGTSLIALNAYDPTTGAATTTGSRSAIAFVPARRSLRRCCAAGSARRCRRSATTRTPRARSACGSCRAKGVVFVLAAFGCGAAGALWLATLPHLPAELDTSACSGRRT